MIHQTKKTASSLLSVALGAAMTLSLAACSRQKDEGLNLITIPAGEFRMGSNEMDTEGKAVQYGSRKPWYLNEHPEHPVTLKEYQIEKTEVTNRAYSAFVKGTGYKPPAHWPGGEMPEAIADHPVTMVSWFDAKAYCEHLGARLPSEAEWEKAARGTDGRTFPWGNEFNDKKLNSFGDHGGTTPVGKFPDGASPYGALDMVGNVQEWVEDSYKPYPGNEYKDDLYGERFKVVRGGGWGGLCHYASQYYVRTAIRFYAPPGGAFDDVGFRCAK